MSFMLGGKEGQWSDRYFAKDNPLTGYRRQYQLEKLGQAGIETAGVMDIRAKRREATMRQQMQRQRAKDLAADRALRIRMSNITLKQKPRAGGSVLGGW